LAVPLSSEIKAVFAENSNVAQVGDFPCVYARYLLACVVYNFFVIIYPIYCATQTRQHYGKIIRGRGVKLRSESGVSGERRGEERRGEERRDRRKKGRR
jgi:hypothetical protein